MAIARKNVLFISWDGPQTSYMEGLFLPIFKAISEQAAFDFHVIQYTWAGREKLAAIQKVATEFNIRYTSHKVRRKPTGSIGSIHTLLTGSGFIKKYIRKNDIDIVMPRSNYPAYLVSKLKSKDLKIVFDADGLALEERVDFAGLKKESFMHRFFSKVERELLQKADAVLTRSNKSIDIHLEKIGVGNRGKFYKVLNGRDIGTFKPDPDLRKEKRQELLLDPQQTLFVYCGSLGPQYGWDEMLAIFKGYQRQDEDAHFLILSGNQKFALDKIPSQLKNKITVMSVPFDQVPAYLSAADIAFAIRQPTYSMQGVSPIKLGEYLLMELPTIASKGVGDTDEIINGLDGAFIFDHNDGAIVDKAITFAKNSRNVDVTKLRQRGIEHFSMQQSASSYIEALTNL
ncbi:Glycosyltransferase involved in cell wall bisynthesis [Nonlabens sp. Hel1_33_55]|uniref:glycosyltransferase n=1 Tax=Nonlabens sp. Hel1_33_55 TaxID=1336802 RepID=UPI000875DA7D|nr:glycosyltransferase [Nonlabens sp. Hel1_33_55]SCX94359.1 Glycosyltransferase involved in cell wall bisynthesis [Nonlabens sp. Hel1_33_55]